MCSNDPKRPKYPNSVNTLTECGTRSADCQTGPARRTRMWEWTDEVHCSVLGTCASIDDLRRLARKLGIAIKPNATNYQIHGFFVIEAARETLFARAFQKLMDQRFGGAIRRVARAKTAEELAALWGDMRDNGQIAAAYWAFMTHGHVPLSMRAAIFGDVHMLSHLAGAQYRSRTIQAVALRDQLQDVKERSSRVEAGLHDTLKRQEEELILLRNENMRLRGRLSGLENGGRRPQTVDAGKMARRVAKLERALIVARFRARAAEQRMTDVGMRARPFAAGPDWSARSRASEEPAEAATPREIAIGNRAILYLGGRLGQIDHFRRIAEEHQARLVYHDGGVEDAVQRIDSLLPSVDCVLCPIDCVSHDASLRAKRACKQLGKPFLPLRNASQASFRAALRHFAAIADTEIK